MGSSPAADANKKKRGFCPLFLLAGGARTRKGARIKNPEKYIDKNMVLYYNTCVDKIIRRVKTMKSGSKDFQYLKKLEEKFGKRNLTEEEILKLEYLIFSASCAIHQDVKNATDSYKYGFTNPEYNAHDEMYLEEAKSVAWGSLNNLEEAIDFAQLVIEKQPRTKNLSKLEKTVRNTKKELRGEDWLDKDTVSEDPLQRKADRFRAKLGDKVGKTADVKSGEKRQEHYEIAQTQAEIMKREMRGCDTPGRRLPKAKRVSKEIIDGKEIEKEFYGDGSYGVRNGDEMTRYFPDGKEQTYRRGFIVGEKLPNGVERRWRHGDLTYEKLADGSSRSWGPNGRQWARRLSDGTRRTWYDDGKNLESEELPDGTFRKWYRNGQIEGERLPGRSTCAWYKNGQMESEYLSDGTFHAWYGNGQMAAERLPDCSERRWYENGQMKSEELPDGTQTRYNRKGKIIFHATKGVEDTAEYIIGQKIEKVHKRLKDKNIISKDAPDKTPVTKLGKVLASAAIKRRKKSAEK